MRSQLLDKLAHSDYKAIPVPSTTKEAIEVGLPMVSAGADLVTGYIKHQLVILAASVNIDQRLNLQPHQLEIIATRLFEVHGYDSIQDIALCLQRGASGLYGQIYRLDGAVIMDWMQKYLDEKYTLIEDDRKNKAESEKQYFSVDYEAFKKRAAEKEAEQKKKSVSNEPLVQAYNPMTPEQLYERQLHKDYLLEKFRHDQNPANYEGTKRVVEFMDETKWREGK